jgi:hypothetical protein
MSPSVKAFSLSLVTILSYFLGLLLAYVGVSLLIGQDSALPWIVCTSAALLTAPLLVIIGYRNHQSIISGRSRRPELRQLVAPSLILAITAIPLVLGVAYLWNGSLAWALGPCALGVVGLAVASRMLWRCIVLGRAAV